MAIARNESVARVGMLLCFSTAILSLVAHWHNSAFTTPEVNSENYGGNVARAADTNIRLTPVSRNNIQQTNVSNPLQTLLANVSTPRIAPQNFTSSNPTKLVVDLSDRRVYVYRSGQVIASYPTGIGKKGWETPTGTFEVDQKQVNPSWRHPITGQVFPAGPDSPLGDRWVGFWSDGRNQIGFHGTPDDELVGYAVSHGCLRMRNPDVRMLYQQVDIGTTVEVRE